LTRNRRRSIGPEKTSVATLNCTPASGDGGDERGRSRAGTTLSTDHEAFAGETPVVSMPGTAAVR